MENEAFVPVQIGELLKDTGDALTELTTKRGSANSDAGETQKARYVYA